MLRQIAEEIKKLKEAQHIYIKNIKKKKKEKTAKSQPDNQQYDFKNENKIQTKKKTGCNVEKYLVDKLRISTQNRILFSHICDTAIHIFV